MRLSPQELRAQALASGLKNIRITIEYDGTDFAGWQRQLSKPTVQSLLEDALSKVLSRKVTVYGASRTDSGVHAAEQVANFWAEPHIDPKKWQAILNDYLPGSIRITDSREVPAEFHAQKNAKSKIYRYRILNRSYASALDRRLYYVPRPLDWDRIREAMKYLVGEKDFKCFQASKASVKTTKRKILRFELIEEGNGVFVFEVEGTGFLKQMVRNMVGTLLDVGLGKRKPEDILKILESLDRRKAGRTVPASGLCLVRVLYS